MKLILALFITAVWLCRPATAAPLAVNDGFRPGALALFDGQRIAPLLVESNADPAVARAARDLGADFCRVTGVQPERESRPAPDGKPRIVIGT